MEKIKMRKKLCFAASSGGHFEQITMLAPLMKKYESFIVTERTQYEASIDGEQIYYLQQVNRNEALFLFRMTVNTFKSMRLFFKEKPDVVITTGVLAVVPLCLIAKVFKKRLIYIESFAKVSSPTKTGQILYRLAEQFYEQWESIFEVNTNGIYLGGIY